MELPSNIKQKLRYTSNPGNSQHLIKCFAIYMMAWDRKLNVTLVSFRMLMTCKHAQTELLLKKK